MWMVFSADPMRVERREQSAYGEMRTLADRFLNRLQRLNCHVIIVGHENEYAKRKADASPKAKPDEAIESISTTVASVTKAHGDTLGVLMSDMLYFELQNSMTGITVSTKAQNGLAVGSRAVEPKTEKWADLGLEKFFAAHN